MEQRNTTHSPRVDDALAEATEAITRGGPVEARTEEWRMAEPPTDGEPPIEAIEEFGTTPIPGALGEDERRRRSELAMALRPSAFPAQRETLLRVAREEHAPDHVLDLLEQLPLGERFDTVGDIWVALGGHDEERASEPPPAAAPIEAADHADEAEAADPADEAEPVDATERGAPVEPAGNARNPIVASLDFGVGIGITVLHAAMSVTRWTMRTATRVFDRAA